MTLKDKHILMMAGGTGGHVFPALAVANALIAEGAQVTWLGTRRGLESNVVPKNSINIEYISVEGLRGKSKASLVLAPFKMLRALWQALRVVGKVKPNAVVGFGGFVAGPGGIIARLLRKPLIIHEQNSVAGLTNKWLAKTTPHVLTGFPNVTDLPEHAQWVGNPVRSDIMPREEGRRKRLRVLVVGGSQGAHSFNMKLPQVFADLGIELKIKHQAGRGKSKQVKQIYQVHDLTAKVVDFIDDMATAYQWADFLVCRAGAMTIAECCAIGKPALLVPFPFSAGDHQIYNANAMVDAGAGVMVLNHELDTTIMNDALEVMTVSREHLHEMGDNAKTLHKPNATQNVVKIIAEAVNA